MLKNIFIFFLVLYFLSSIQINFFIHFGILNQGPNLILVFLFLTIFFNKKISFNLFFPGAFLAGLFLDFINSIPLGLSAFIFLIEIFILREVLKGVRKQNLLVFLFIFLAFALVYEQALIVFDYFSGVKPLPLYNKFVLIRVSYSLFFGLLAFWLCLIFKHQKVLGTRE